MDSAQPDAIVCANDWTAARVMHTLLALGHAVPGDVRLVGIDDVEYAALLPVPLTTLRQPTRQIGAAALAAMLDRVAGADLPTRDILLHGTLVVRRSCGAPPAAPSAPAQGADAPPTRVSSFASASACSSAARRRTRPPCGPARRTRTASAAP